MGYKPRKGSNGRSKLHAVRQHRSSKNHARLSSCIHRCVGGEGLRRVRNYIMKALDFGVESGYLVPTDKTYRTLRVSSDLLGKHKRRSTTGKTTRHRSKACESSRCSLEREKDDELDDEIQSTMRFEEYPVQDAKRKRRRSARKRSRSRSRRRRRRSSRRRKRSENPEEAREDEDDEDYELNLNAGKKNTRTEHPSNDSKNTRSKTQDTSNTDAKGTDDISDLSVDEDDSDEEEDKKEANTTKS